MSANVNPTTWQRSPELEKHLILLKEGKSKEHRLGGKNRKHTATGCLHTEISALKTHQILSLKDKAAN